MGGLLDTANLVRTGESFGTSSYDLPSPTPFMRSALYDVCDPTNEHIDVSGLGVGDPYPSSDCILPRANVFAVVVDLGSRAMRSEGNEEELVRSALDIESEKAAGIAMWGGDYASPPPTSLSGADVATVAAGADPAASLVAALGAYWKRSVGIDYPDTIIHLGVAHLVSLFGQIEGGVVKNLDIRVATSPGYPDDLIAVTGPVTIKLGPDEVDSNVDRSNAMVSEASRLVAIEFDPAAAVRVG